MKLINSMKKLGVGILLASLLVTGLEAKEKYTKEDRVKDMLTMAEGLDDIQMGLLYRCKDGSCVKTGIERIKKVLHTIDKVDPEFFLDKDQVYANKFAKKTRSMIEMYLTEIEDAVKKDDKEEILHNYSLTMRQCMSCHIRLRK